MLTLDIQIVIKKTLISMNDDLKSTRERNEVKTD